MATDQPTAAEARRKRTNRRLRALLALNALALGVYVFVRLDRSVAERLGPVGEGVYDLFNQVPGKPAPLTAAARRLSEDVKALGGVASIHVTRPGLFGTIGQEEWCNVMVRAPRFDDAALARLGEAHGGQIGGLYLDNTGVTDAGLRSLGRFTRLRHLEIRDAPNRGVRRPKITDAGMAHLKGLDHLWSLNLSGLPITDSGLEAIGDLPELNSLYLSRTGVQGRSLSKLRSLPRLSIIYLDDSRMMEEGLRALSGATSLQILSLNGVHLTPKALPLLRAIPRVDRLELTGCGFLDEEVDALVASKPGLKVIRR